MMSSAQQSTMVNSMFRLLQCNFHLVMDTTRIHDSLIRKSWVSRKFSIGGADSVVLSH